MVRVPRGVGLRIRSGPEGSSLKRSPAGAAGAPELESWATIRRPARGVSTRGARSTPEPLAYSRMGLRDPSAALEDQPRAVGVHRAEPWRNTDRDVGIAGVEHIVF